MNSLSYNPPLVTGDCSLIVYFEYFCETRPSADPAAHHFLWEAFTDLKGSNQSSTQQVSGNPFIPSLHQAHYTRGGLEGCHTNSKVQALFPSDTGAWNPPL